MIDVADMQLGNVAQEIFTSYSLETQGLETQKLETKSKVQMLLITSSVTDMLFGNVAQEMYISHIQGQINFWSII